MESKLMIEQSKKGTALYIAGALVMAAACAVLTVIDFRKLGNVSAISALIDIPIVYVVLKVILGAGIIFFGYAGFILMKRAKNKTILLQADDQGVTDNSSAISFGFIPWTDVKRVYLGEMMGNVFIELELVDVDKYLSKVGGLKRKSIEMNLKMGHQAVCITLNSTGRNPQEVCTELQRIFNLVGHGPATAEKE